MLTLCVAVAAASQGTRPALAQSDAEEEALRHYERGNEHMEKKEYKKAARAFKDSYRAKRAPLLLYNVGQAYRLAGEDRKAIEYYEDFLSEEPNMDPFSDRARKYIEAINKRLEREDTSAGAGSGGDEESDFPAEEEELASDVGDTEDFGDDGYDDEGGDEGDDRVADDDTAGTVSKGDKDPGKVWRYSGLGLMGVGAVSLVVGLKFGYDTYNGWRCLEQYQTPGACDGVLENHDPSSWTKEADDYQKRGFPITRAKMYIFTGAGTAAIVVGGYIYYRSKKLDRERRQSERSVQVTPDVGADSVGVALTGAF